MLSGVGLALVSVLGAFRVTFLLKNKSVKSWGVKFYGKQREDNKSDRVHTEKSFPVVSCGTVQLLISLGMAAKGLDLQKLV